MQCTKSILPMMVDLSAADERSRVEASSSLKHTVGSKEDTAETSGLPVGGACFRAQIFCNRLITGWTTGRLSRLRTPPWDLGIGPNWGKEEKGAGRRDLAMASCCPGQSSPSRTGSLRARLLATTGSGAAGSCLRFLPLPEARGATIGGISFSPKKQECWNSVAGSTRCDATSGPSQYHTVQIGASH